MAASSCRVASSFTVLLAIAAAVPAARAGGSVIYAEGNYATPGDYNYGSNSTSGARVLAGNGVGAANVYKDTLQNGGGSRAARFGAAGSVELGNLGLGNATLSNLPPHTNVYVHGLAPNGTAVGGAMKYDGPFSGFGRAVRWDAGATAATELGLDGGYDSSTAFAVNASGTAVGGVGLRYAADARAARWDAGQTAVTLLGDYGGQYGSEAVAVSDTGYVVGSAQRPNLGHRAVRWGPGSTMPVELLPLGTGPGGDTTSRATKVNDAGAAVGVAVQYIGTTPGWLRAVRWDAGTTTPTALGSLGVASNNSADTAAYDLNNAGVAVGFSAKYGIGVGGGTYRGPRPVRWDAGSAAVVALGLFDATDGVNSGGRAWAINDSGAIVGSIADVPANGGAEVAVLWDDAGTPMRLSDLLPANNPWARLTRATDVTNAGWVAGYGTQLLPGGGTEEHAFLLLVPDAGTYGLGDADFDGDVDFADLARLAANYMQASGGSTDVADLDLDGDTDFADLARLAANYGGPLTLAQEAQLGAAFAGQWALARASVPEPGVALVVATGAVALARRRRR